MEAKIRAKLMAVKIGHVTTLWDLLVYRVSETRWVVGHLSIYIADHGLSIDAAVEKFSRLLD